MNHTLKVAILAVTWPELRKQKDLLELGPICETFELLQKGGTAEQAALIMGKNDFSLAIWCKAVDKALGVK